MAVALCPGPRLVPSAKSIWFAAPIIPGKPNGGLETVRDSAPASAVPLLVTRNLSVRVSFSVTLPNVKFFPWT